MTQQLPNGKLNTHLLNDLLADITHTDDRLFIPPGVGQDAAGLFYKGGYLSLTTDPITFSSNRLGTYSVAVNINDICCLGCKPCWYSATLLLPLGTTESMLRAIWSDLNHQLDHYRVQLIGGHIEVTDSVTRPVLAGQMIGEPMGEKLIDIRQCKPNDQILLYQPIAIEGTATLAYEKQQALQAHFTLDDIFAMQNLLDDPGICLWPFAASLFTREGIRGLHDPTEGGLATALHEVADACGFGIRVNQHSIPILKATQKLTQIYQINPLGLLSSGSLLIICQTEFAGGLLTDLPNAPLYHIGHITEDDNIILNNGEKTEALPRFDQDEITNVL